MKKNNNIYSVWMEFTFLVVNENTSHSQTNEKLNFLKQLIMRIRLSLQWK